MNTEQGYLLVVEDDPDILNLLETTLTFRDYRVVTTQNGREALEAVQRERPMIVIADIMMPHVDGFGLVHRLRINPETRHIPVLFITATYVAPEDRDFALKIGVTRILQKPVDLEVFLKTVDELLRGGPHTSVETLDEIKFYEGYRRRLEVKLDQKIKQIAREEHLLGSHSDAEDQDLQVSLRHAVRERDELKLLIEEIHKQLDRLGKPE
jgi:DNA-binding response OmpR family regulator